MKLEELVALGLTEEVAKNVLVLHGKGIEAHKSTITTLEKSVETLTGQLTEAGTQIKAFKDMNIEQVKENAAKWETTAKEAETALKTETAKMKQDFALQTELTSIYGAKDSKEIMLHLNREKITTDEAGKFIGLKEQVEPLQTSKGYLFNTTAGGDGGPGPRIVAGANGGQGSSTPAAALLANMRQGAGLRDAAATDAK